MLQGDELENLRIPVGGDQLTRERLQGAASLRSGAHTATERLEQLQPVIVELFHTLQDFLEKLCKRFLDLKNSREVGTLAWYKVLIHRDNVNGKVKSRFAAHEDFVSTVGKALFRECALDHFGMSDNTSELTCHNPPDNVKHLHAKKKEEAFHTTMDGVLDKVLVKYWHLDTAEKDVHLTVNINGTIIQVLASVEGTQASFFVSGTENKRYNIRIPLTKLKAKEKCVFQIPASNVTISVSQSCDDMYNYSVNFLQYVFLIWSFKDAIREGDIFRTNVCLKLMIPLFYTHSILSKYMAECIDYIQKTEILLTPRLSMRVRTGSFINRTGKIGHNKPADIEKENQVKLLKELIRGLGSNKTEAAMIRISKAAPVIETVAHKFDEVAGVSVIHTTHKSKSAEVDLKAIEQKLREIVPFHVKHGRMLSFAKCSRNPVSEMNVEKFKSMVCKTALRLRRGQVVDNDENTDSEVDDEIEGDNEAVFI